MGVGTGAPVLLDIVALLLIHQELGSIAGAWLWFASLLIMGATGFALRNMQGWAARWGVGVWPDDPLGRILLIVGIAALLIVAAAARLIILDKVPFGVNADEGDRAALAIQIARGDNIESIFSDGWYYISMLYFWLMAQFFKLFGIGFVQARAFTALAGIISVGVVTWMGIRNFGLRVGLLAGALLSLLAVSLQFARFTSESGPTAMLWTVSVALFLEAARRGRSWAWIGAGVAGGLSLYFYPTGRLWALLAGAFCIYLFVNGLGGRRWGIVRGTALAAVAALMVMGPFLVNSLNHLGTLSERAQQTSIFTGDNPTRLSYYKPEWNIFQLLSAQIVRSVGIFNQFGDEGTVWPTNHSILWGLLAVLVLLGPGWCCLRWRDPRYAVLAIWFWVGFVGVIVTVETPNLQRMATAVPALALFPALVLDNLARRVETLARADTPRVRQVAGWAATGVAAAIIAFFMFDQSRYYFTDYAKVDRWMHSTTEGQAVNSQGKDTLVVTLGRQFHMVNSGWVRLLAPDTPRGGVQSPGSTLPLALPADKNLAFMVYPKQQFYLPYISQLYPEGATTVYTHPTEGLMFTMYEVSRQQWQTTQGATVHPLGGTPQRVGTLGEAPPGWSKYPSQMQWTAGLRVPQYWNYAFEAGPGPASLTIDGANVLAVPNGTSVMSATVSLARGDHAVVYDGTLAASGQPALFKWASVPQTDKDQPAPVLEWHAVKTEELVAAQTAPYGLYGAVQIEGRPEQRRIDSTLATCCLANLVHNDGHEYTATWTGTLNAPTTGVYSMTLLAQGITDLKLDGKSVIHTDATADEPVGASITLGVGPHPVEMVFRGKDGPGGLEWTWAPPGDVKSIVPPSALSPPAQAGIGPPVLPDVLGKRDNQPVDEPLDIVK